MGREPHSQFECPIAQLVERTTVNRDVAGSRPARTVGEEERG